MSKWGIIYEHQMERRLKRKGGHKETAEMVEEMSTLVCNQEQEIRNLEREITDFKTELLHKAEVLMAARSEVSRLSGYIQRVKDCDNDQT